MCFFTFFGAELLIKIVTLVNPLEKPQAFKNIQHCISTHNMFSET